VRDLPASARNYFFFCICGPGEVVTCGDEITQVLYPGFLIESLDFEEAWNFTCCRPGRAKFSCPCCLVLQEMLHFLQRTFEARTSSNMRATVRLAQNAPNTMQKEKILMEMWSGTQQCG
jgi:hypothetical protein